MALFLWALLQAGSPSPLAPVPDPAAQKEIEKTLRDIFKAEYQKRAPADRLALAEKLKEQAQGSKDDPPTQYVLGSEARDLYLEGGDLASALKMVEFLEHR